MTQPNPGSPEAIAKGCSCPRIDNGNGKGAMIGRRGEPVFWITTTCPVHGTPLDKPDDKVYSE